MGVVPFKKTGTAPESTPWSWDADTQNQILGSDDDPNWARYRAAHAWYDASDDEKKSAYKLPHHRMGDDGLEAVWHGVSAAMARLEQSDLPEADMKGAFEHLAKHYAQWDKDAPEWDRWIAGVRARRQRHVASRTAAALPMVATRAPIAVTAARPGGAPTDDDLARINALARSPLDAGSVYVFPAEISNQSVDAYYTRMTSKSLQQFAQDASRGVAVCDSHNHYQLPIGRSFYGTVASDVSGMMSTQSLAYMLRGMRTPSGMQTDDIIRGIEGGVNADVSIGFIPDAYWCSICHMDMLNNWDCMHWPGNTYEIKDPDTGVVSNVLCIADVDARLAEYSLVYDGATPNAMVLKAEAALDSGRMTPEMARQIRLVEEHCRVKLIDRWSGFGDGTLGKTQQQQHMWVRHEPSPTPEEEWESMRGSEFITRYIETVTAEATRVGKQVSQANLDRLTAMHDKLSNGHDTMDEALREMATFISDVSSGAGGDTDGDGDNPAGGDDPDADGRNMPGTAAEIRAVNAVEVRADGSHDAFTGTHTHSHAAFGSQGDDATHEHEHGHDGDANHEHSHATNAAPGVATADGLSKRGIEVPADGVMRTATLGGLAGDDGLTPEQRAIFALGERVLKEAHDEAIAWAVRANIVKSPEDEQRYRAMFARCSFDEVQTFRTSWEQIAKANLSPRGTWTPDRSAPGGGRWSDVPTMTGGRQTQAADPNDPQRLGVAGVARTASITRPHTAGAAASTSRESDDAKLYTIGGKRRGK